jgi:amidase
LRECPGRGDHGVVAGRQLHRLPAFARHGEVVEATQVGQGRVGAQDVELARDPARRRSRQTEALEDRAERLRRAVAVDPGLLRRIAHAIVGVKRPQRELSDLWCRQIMPTNVLTFETFKDNGLDLLRDHRGDLPEEYLRWIEAGYPLSAVDFYKDHAIRSEIYHAIQGVLNEHQLLITPTLACLPVENASDGNIMGPAEVEGEQVDRLIGWCLTYLVNFTGHPAASIPAGLVEGLPAGMQIIGRRYADADVLAASAAFERLRPWRDSYRICAARPL